MTEVEIVFQCILVALFVAASMAGFIAVIYCWLPGVKDNSVGPPSDLMARYGPPGRFEAGAGPFTIIDGTIVDSNDNYRPINQSYITANFIDLPPDMLEPPNPNTVFKQRQTPRFPKEHDVDECPDCGADYIDADHDTDVQYCQFCGWVNTIQESD